MTLPRRFVAVAAIEGIDTLLCTTNEAGVLTAWSGTDYTAAQDGLLFDLDERSSAHPWEPFTGGGQLTLTILNDDIGTLMHRSAGAADTELVTGLDRDDTTVTVKDTSAFASSGHIYCGVETISYASKNATSFLTCVRGVFHPIGCDSTGLGGARFGHPHRVDTTGYSPPVGPRVTQFPTEWVGRWVTLTIHGYESDGTLQTKANAARVFAGRISEVRDDPEALGTIVVCDSVLTVLKETTVGSDQFVGSVADGIFIPAGKKFGATDHNGSTQETADNLVVVASGASGAYQMNEGFYTHETLHSALNTWLAQALDDADLHGTYEFSIDSNQLCTKIGWQIPGSSSVATYSIGMPKAVARFMGFNAAPLNDVLGNELVKDTDTGGVWHSTPGTEVPLRTWVNNGLSTVRLKLENLQGAFADQYDTMPLKMKPPSTGVDGTGLFIVDDKILVRANVEDNGDDTFTLSDVDVFAAFGDGAEDLEALRAYSRRIDEPGEVRVKQVLIFEGGQASVLNQLMYSTGNATLYNHDTYDVLPFGAGVAMPGGLLGAAWETSVNNLPAASKPIAIVIDKPTKLSALIGSDLLLRFAFPIFRDGGLRMAAWQTPTASLAIASLTEHNKAEASGTDANHRTSTLLSDRWKSNSLKIQYNREIVGSSDYRSTAYVEDRTAIDDGGSARSPRTIDARNTYDEFTGTGSGIEDIIPTVFIPTVTLFTRAMRTLRRSVSVDEYLDLAPGDVITVTDRFARDPDSGERGITTRPATVIGHRWQLKNGPAGNALDFAGEVELMFTRGNRFYAYSPSALVDAAADSDGFSSGYNSSVPSIRCVEHTYSESGEPADAENFAAGDFITIMQIDPSNPASITSWFREVDSRDGNDLILTSTLSSPAWDPTLEYLIKPQRYDFVQDSQKDKAFQADSTDGLIRDEAQANTFGLATSTIDATAHSHTSLPERHANLSFGDGVAYDVGSIVGFQRMVDNLIDHKTALSVPMLGATMSNSTYSSGQGRKTVQIIPIALTTALLSNSVMRYVSIAPFLRSSDGTATSVRISLCDKPPMDTTLDDITIPLPNSQATWATSSTTWATGTPALLSLSVKDGFGWGWLIVECAYKSECRGIGKFREQQRSVFV